jgi:hypothetical protein
MILGLFYNYIDNITKLHYYAWLAGSVQGSGGMRMPVSTSTPPVGAMPISQHQQSSLGRLQILTQRYILYLGLYIMIDNIIRA